MQNSNTGYLDVTGTNILKGLALMMLLWHHLFYQHNGLYADIQLTNGMFLVQESGRLCKMCVAIFVFLSGYGLTRQAETKGSLGNLTQWYWHRYAKLMTNYWLIWFLFVPLGVFAFGHTLTEAYHSHIWLKLIADMLGIANLFGFHGYNATWWFISCIIILYAFFPLLYRLSKKLIYTVLVIGLIVSFLPVKTGASNIHPYFFPFVFGMVVALRPAKINGGGKFLALIAIPVLTATRIFLSGKVVTDSLMATSLLVIGLSFNIPQTIRNVLSFIGRHSMNIFMFHTFIFSHWLTSFVYSPGNPILIFLLLLSVCLALSVAIEWIKQKVHFNCLLK